MNKVELRKIIVDILEKNFGKDNNFIVTYKYKRYDMVANDILEKLPDGFEPE